MAESKFTLYHGSPNKVCVPKFGLGEQKHDYGKGFYLTFDIELAKEWAVCLNHAEGYVHKYELDISELEVLELNKKYPDVLTWLSVLSKHRSGVTSKRDRLTEKKLIEKYYPKEIEKVDVIIGYRANDSFFSFSKQAIRGEVDISLLNEIMHEGQLGLQVFIQSEKAFSKLSEITELDKTYYEIADYDVYNAKYNERDRDARNYVADIIDSDRNTLNDTIEKYL